ncbi:MAG: hypothetical protein V4615_05000 [Bacteroidota bacterium]
MLPITFNYQGETVTGNFKQIGGAGGKCWYLFVDGFYRGKVTYTDRLRYDGNKYEDVGEMLCDFIKEKVIL